jgi:hypothetical protein
MFKISKPLKIILAIFLVIGFVAYGYWTAGRPKTESSQESANPAGPTLPPEPAATVEPLPTFNFSETGNIIVPPWGDQSFVYGKEAGQPTILTLQFTNKSFCILENIRDYCVFVNYNSGDPVTIEGIRNGNTLLVTKITILETTADPNPAAFYCEKHDGKIRIVDADGTKQSFCDLPNGTSYRAWDLYKSATPGVE